MKHLLIALALLATPAFAQRVTPCSPQTPNNALCVGWEAPTTNVDGSPTILPLTYRVEQRTGTDTTWVTVATVSTTQAYIVNLAPGSYTFRVFAIAGGLESVASNTATKTTTAIPTPPTAPVIKIAVVISPDAPPYVITVNGQQVYASATP